MSPLWNRVHGGSGLLPHLRHGPAPLLAQFPQPLGGTFGIPKELGIYQSQKVVWFAFTLVVRLLDWKRVSGHRYSSRAEEYAGIFGFRGGPTLAHTVVDGCLCGVSGWHPAQEQEI